jgi:hypothetical protein
MVPRVNPFWETAGKLYNILNILIKKYISGENNANNYGEINIFWNRGWANIRARWELKLNDIHYLNKTMLVGGREW